MKRDFCTLFLSMDDTESVADSIGSEHHWKSHGNGASTTPQI